MSSGPRFDLISRIVRKLDTIPRSRFRFSVWVAHDWKGKPDLSCGTSACAMGWATTLPSMRKLGLSLSPDHLLLKKRDRTYYNIDAIVELLRIDRDEAKHLFVPSYATGLNGESSPEEVANHIRKWVREKKDELRNKARFEAEIRREKMASRRRASRALTKRG